MAITASSHTCMCVRARVSSQRFLKDVIRVAHRANWTSVATAALSLSPRPGDVDNNGKSRLTLIMHGNPASLVFFFFSLKHGDNIYLLTFKAPNKVFE